MGESPYNRNGLSMSCIFASIFSICGSVVDTGRFWSCLTIKTAERGCPARRLEAGKKTCAALSLEADRIDCSALTRETDTSFALLLFLDTDFGIFDDSEDINIEVESRFGSWAEGWKAISENSYT